MTSDDSDLSALFRGLAEPPDDEAFVRSVRGRVERDRRRRVLVTGLGGLAAAGASLTVIWLWGPALSAAAAPAFGEAGVYAIIGLLAGAISLCAPLLLRRLRS